MSTAVITPARRDLRRRTAREAGAFVGRQARAKGFAVQLAGGANLVREATGGRNFEYVSEDPLLTGEIAGASVAGIQLQGVVSTMNHFAVNAQETGRVMADSVINEAAPQESDLLALGIGIERGCPGALIPGLRHRGQRRRAPLVRPRVAHAKIRGRSRTVLHDVRVLGPLRAYGRYGRDGRRHGHEHRHVRRGRRALVYAP